MLPGIVTSTTREKTSQNGFLLNKTGVVFVIELCFFFVFIVVFVSARTSYQVWTECKTRVFLCIKEQQSLPGLLLKTVLIIGRFDLMFAFYYYWR